MPEPPPALGAHGRRRSRHSDGRDITYCVCDDLATLVWLANLADLELHTPLGRAAAPEQPTVIAFDLDPGPPATIVECAEVACRLRDAFDHFGLVAFPKTSGSKGMQVYVPLNTPATFARHAGVLARRRAGPGAPPPGADRVGDAQGPAPGQGVHRLEPERVFKTTVCVYSLRARERPTVSTPVTWDEVEAVLRSREPDELSFTSDEVLARVAEHGDCFAPVLSLQQELPG